MKPLKQQCYLWSVWLTWLGLPALALAIGMRRSWWAGAFVLGAGTIAQFLYIKMFSRVSRWLGYGSVEDVASDLPRDFRAISKIILYTANVCPFCPIVRQRIISLQREMHFEFEEIDITFRQELIKQKGFRSVPVIEIDGRYLIGNATTAQLVAFFAGNGE